MSPRRYKMKERAAAVEQTRRRIVEAAVGLHGAKGIFGTTWQDIANEADVSVGTVYKHFRSLDELVPACGALLMERIRPPMPDEADAIIGDATDPEQRLTRAAAQLFSFYERGGRHLESDLREQELPAVQEWEGYLRDTVRAFVAAALAPLDPEEPAIASIAFLFDLRTFTAMRLRGMDVSSAVEVAVRMAIGYAGARPRQA